MSKMRMKPAKRLLAALAVLPAVKLVAGPGWGFREPIRAHRHGGWHDGRALSAPALWPLALSPAHATRPIEWIPSVRRQNRLIAQAVANLCPPCRR